MTKTKTHASRPSSAFASSWEAARYVYEDAQAGQFVIDDDGERVYGVWVHPDKAPDTPTVIDRGSSQQIQ